MKTKIIILFCVVLFLVLLEQKQRKNNTPKTFYLKRVPLGFNGFAMPCVGIFISEKERKNNELFLHELRHWQQYQKEGCLPFLAKYIYYNIAMGYDANPFEIDARYRENEYAKYNYTEAVRTGKARTVYNPDFRK